jgi:hypothetical protein
MGSGSSFQQPHQSNDPFGLGSNNSTSQQPQQSNDPFGGMMGLGSKNTPSMGSGMMQPGASTGNYDAFASLSSTTVAAPVAVVKSQGDPFAGLSSFGGMGVTDKKDAGNEWGDFQ